MSHRRTVRFRPGLEPVEPRQLPSAGPLTAATATRATGPVHASGASGVQHPPISPGGGYLAFRVTQRPYPMVPPFQHVLVQSNPPVPGQVYTVNFVALKNGTAKTFDASSGFTVRLNNQSRGHAYPILTGDQQWKPQQVILFYVLIKKYYPVSFVPGGYQFNLGGRSSTLVPGPSGIFLRLKYNPATFDRTLDWIATRGPGTQGGKGLKFGMPVTTVNEFVAARTRRIDYGGHF